MIPTGESPNRGPTKRGGRVFHRGYQGWLECGCGCAFSPCTQGMKTWDEKKQMQWGWEMIMNDNN